MLAGEENKYMALKFFLKNGSLILVFLIYFFYNLGHCTILCIGINLYRNIILKYNFFEFLELKDVYNIYRPDI